MEKQDNFDFFVEKYSRQRDETSRQVERIVLGHDVGLNGYTTVQQAQVLCNALELTNNSNLLDVGGGSGWPGLYIAQKSACRLTSTDVPIAALRDAKANAAVRGLQATTQVLAADGRALSFQRESFDGIVHTDVFC